MRTYVLLCIFPSRKAADQSRKKGFSGVPFVVLKEAACEQQNCRCECNGRHDGVIHVIRRGPERVDDEQKNDTYRADRVKRRVLTEARIVHASFRAARLWVLLKNAAAASARIVGTVFRTILRSRQSDNSRAYLISRRIISVNVVLFFPLTCHKPVMPGAASNRAVCHN